MSRATRRSANCAAPSETDNPPSISVKRNSVTELLLFDGHLWRLRTRGVPKLPVKNGRAKISYFFLLTSNFPRRRISRYAQIDLIFAGSPRVKCLNVV